MFGPLHQGVELLLARELELCLYVGVHADAGLVQLELVAHPLGLQDPLGRHVSGSEVAVLGLVIPHPLVTLGPLPLLLDSLPLHPTGNAFVVTTKLTTVPLTFVNQAVSVFTTCICKFLSHCSFKESLQKSMDSMGIQETLSLILPYNLHKNRPRNVFRWLDLRR